MASPGPPRQAVTSIGVYSCPGPSYRGHSHCAIHGLATITLFGPRKTPAIGPPYLSPLINGPYTRGFRATVALLDYNATHSPGIHSLMPCVACGNHTEFGWFRTTSRRPWQERSVSV